MKKLIILIFVCVFIGVAFMLLLPSGSSNDAAEQSVRVTRKTITRSATAVGRIEVEHEVPVKSRTGGILTNLHVKLGQYVNTGDILAEVRPVATTMTLLQAERALEAASDGEEEAREYMDGENLAGLAARLFRGNKSIERMYKSATLGRQQAEENLKLLKEGKVIIDNRQIDYKVRAPVSGNILEIIQREGSPVVPSSSYGSGTVLLTVAEMKRLLFRGTVNEIDVGRLTEGMTARIKIGALPEEKVMGTLNEISLKSQVRNDAVVFNVRIELDIPETTVIRSGYSAVADIEVARKENVLTLPERVIEFRDGSAFVTVPDGEKGRREQQIQTGLSDGMTVEIRKGLEEGDQVFERIYK